MDNQDKIKEHREVNEDNIKEIVKEYIEANKDNIYIYIYIYTYIQIHQHAKQNSVETQQNTR